LRRAWILGMALLLGCESVPDIYFVDADADADAGVDASSVDARAETGVPQTDASPDADAASMTCPGSLPEGATTCCGAHACSGDCGADNCAKCARDCAPTQLCCGKPNNVLCQTLPGKCK